MKAGDIITFEVVSTSVELPTQLDNEGTVIAFVPYENFQMCKYYNGSGTWLSLVTYLTVEPTFWLRMVKGEHSPEIDSEILTPREKWVYNYLKVNYTEDILDGGWCRPTEVGKAYGKFVLGKKCHSATGSPICKALVEKGFAERNKKGHYRYIANKFVL